MRLQILVLELHFVVILILKLTNGLIHNLIVVLVVLYVVQMEVMKPMMIVQHNVLTHQIIPVEMVGKYVTVVIALLVRL